MPQEAVMTLRQAEREFRVNILPFIKRQFGRDKVAIRMAWNDWTDTLHKEGRITAKQYDRWISSFNR